MFVSYTLLHSCRRRLTLWTLYDTSHNYPTLGLMYRLIRNYHLLMSSLTSRYLSQSSCNCSCANTMTRLNHCLYAHIPCLLHCYRYCRLQSAHRSLIALLGAFVSYTTIYPLLASPSSMLPVLGNALS